MKRQKTFWLQRPALILALSLAIPAFYLILTGPNIAYRNAGSILYALTAILMAIDFWVHKRLLMRASSLWKESLLDTIIFIGALLSSWPASQSWPFIEWIFRLGFCGIVFIRIAMLMAGLMAPRHILQLLAISVALLGIAGAGFYWLEPKVLSYADGLWLAFTTGATVGYGDLVPSTPASRIFAVFIVLLGYAIFSVVTASIAAIFVGEDEKRFEKELHADIRSLRKEIAGLRDELHRSTAVNQPNDNGEESPG